MQADSGPEYREENLGEREIGEHDRAERDLEHLPEDNEAHAPGKVCERCPLDLGAT
jgi:hypothetical protein